MIDTTNRCLVSRHQERIVLLHLARAANMSDDEALNLAAYLVATSKKSFDEFKKVYDAICAT